MDVVDSQWSEGLSRFYAGISRSLNLELDLDDIQKARPRMVELLNSGDPDRKSDD